MTKIVWGVPLPPCFNDFLTTALALLSLQEIWTIEYCDGKYTSKCIFHHDMGTEIIMNSVTHPNDPCTLAAGIGHSCHMLHITRDGKL